MGTLTITQSDDAGNSYSGTGVEWDEFIPYVDLRNTSGYNTEKHDLPLEQDKDGNYVYVDLLGQTKNSQKRKTITTLPTALTKPIIPFSVEKGGPDSYFEDEDGYITVELSLEKDTFVKVEGATAKMKLKSDTEFGDKVFAKFGSEIEVEIDITAKKSLEFYIRFLANDDEDTFKGEYENLFCGCFKVIFENCVCSDWSTVSPIIPKSKFIGWGHPGIKMNCFHYCLEQLRVAGYGVKSGRWNKKWDGTKEINDDIYQIFLEQDVAGMKKGVQEDQFEKGIKYLKEAIKNKIPVMVGVDDDLLLLNDDMTTEHFVVIVGMGSDSNGNYFLFYDNATGNKSIGTSADNKLYCSCKELKLEGKGDLSNDYIQGTLDKKYTVTQIRESK